MKVTPLDIRRKEFKRSMRGYSDEEVDVFLDDVADEFERLFQENIELQDRIQRLEEQIASHTQIREALEKTLISAQLQSDEIRANARKESELTLRDAELKARHIVNESYSETQRVQQALIQLKRLEEDFRFKFRSLLEGHLKLLDEVPISVPGAVQPVGSAGDVESLVPAGASEPAVGATGPEPAVSQLDLSVAAEQESGGPAAEGETLPSGSTVEPTGPESLIRETKPETGEGILRGEEDEVPTEETVLGPSELVAELVGTVGEVANAGPWVPTEEAIPAAEAAAPSPETAHEAEEEPRVGGYFFGRRLDNADDSFFTPETAKKDKDRDFEW